MSPIIVVAILTFASALAAVVSRLIPRALLPTLVVEIAAGIALGPQITGILQADNDVVTLLGQLGFATLMLIAGLEIDLEKLAGSSHGSGPKPIWLAVGMSAITIAIATGGVYLIIGTDGPWTHIAIYAVVLSTTSVGIVVPTIQERRLGSTVYGQTILSTALLSDFITMFAISALAGIIASGAPSGASGSVALVGIGILAIAVAPRILLPFSARSIESRTSLPLIRAIFALLFMAVWLASALESELILAAFFSGLVLGRLLPRDDHRRETVEAIGYGFLVPFFFISVGMKFDLAALGNSPSSLLLVPAFLLLAFANKMIPSLLLRKRHGLRASLAGGALLSARLSLIVAASDIALRVGVFDAATDAAMILLAVLTAVLGPVLFNILLGPDWSGPEAGTSRSVS